MQSIKLIRKKATTNNTYRHSTMRQVLITESALRGLLRELMNSFAPVHANPVVDPSAAETDPTNQNFIPSNKLELLPALRALVEPVEDDKVPEIYVMVKDAFEAAEEKEANMKKSNVEETIRSMVRNIISEMNEADLPPVKKIPYGVHGAEYLRNLEKSKKGLQSKFAAMRDDEDSEEMVRADEPASGRSRKNVMMGDVEGASFKDIAKELGFAAESGAKGAVERALAKAKFVGSMDPDELEILVLKTMSDYIDALEATNELSAADVKLLKSHPDIVRELEGFREYLDDSIRKARKLSGE